MSEERENPNPPATDITDPDAAGLISPGVKGGLLANPRRYSEDLTLLLRAMRGGYGVPNGALTDVPNRVALLIQGMRIDENGDVVAVGISTRTFLKAVQVFDRLLRTNLALATVLARLNEETRLGGNSTTSTRGADFTNPGSLNINVQTNVGIQVDKVDDWYGKLLADVADLDEGREGRAA